MASLVPSSCRIVLEPTPGLGNLVKALRGKGFQVRAPSDFAEITTDRRFDAIVMNPPFTPMQCGYDILYRCMEMSDHIVALLPWLALINSQRRAQDIRTFGLKTVTHLPRSTFQGSRVQCCVLEMKRGYSGETLLRFLSHGETQPL
jgi:methylase of polypeptide subunit release factors